MSPTFTVSRALVTGAARGIGASIAERLANDGLDVAIVDLDQAAADETAKRIADATGRKVVGFACDVSDRDAVNAIVPKIAETLGGIDTLITNAGIARDAFVHKMTDEQWDQVIGVHLTGTFAFIRACAPYLREEGPGRVVCISSVSAAMGNLGQANYTAAKGGIVSMSKSVAREFARSQTTVNVVRPGFVDTDMTRAMPDDARNFLISVIPLGRAGKPEEIAGAVSYLVSDDASFITGAVLDVNGGFYM